MEREIELSRLEERRLISKFIQKANIFEVAEIVGEIKDYHGIVAFNPSTRLLSEVESVHVNVKSIQLNLES